MYKIQSPPHTLFIWKLHSYIKHYAFFLPPPPCHGCDTNVISFSVKRCIAGLCNKPFFFPSANQTWLHLVLILNPSKQALQNAEGTIMQLNTSTSTGFITFSKRTLVCVSSALLHSRSHIEVPTDAIAPREKESDACMTKLNSCVNDWPIREQILTFAKPHGEDIITPDICTHFFVVFMPSTVTVIWNQFEKNEMIMKKMTGITTAAKI